jgi:hypothetical protein
VKAYGLRRASEFRNATTAPWPVARRFGAAIDSSRIKPDVTSLKQRGDDSPRRPFSWLHSAIAAVVIRTATAVADHTDRFIHGKALQIENSIHDDSPWL